MPDALLLRHVVLKRTGLVRDVRKPVLVPLRGRDNDLLGVRINNQIGVVGDENDLAPPFRCLEVRRQQLVDRLVVEIFVGLIDNQRAGIGNVHAEIQDQQDDALRAWRQLFEFGAVIFEAIAEPYVLGFVQPL